MVAWVLPGVTWCYWSVTWVVILGKFLFCELQIPAFLKPKLLKNIIFTMFHLEMLPGPAPVLVIWLPGPPSVHQVTAGCNSMPAMCWMPVTEATEAA